MFVEHTNPPPDSAFIRRVDCAARLRQLRRQRRYLFGACVALVVILTGFSVWMLIDAFLAMSSPDQQLPMLLSGINEMNTWTLVLLGLGFACALAGVFSALVATEARILRVAELADDFPPPKTWHGSDDLAQ